MALVTHQLQGLYASPRPLSLKRGIESNKLSATFSIVKRSDILLLKHRSCLCVKTPRSKKTSLKISSFKGNVHHDESGGKENGSKSIKNPVKLSYVAHDLKETLAESAKVQNNHDTPISNTGQTVVGSLAIQPNGPLVEPSTDETVETDCTVRTGGKSVILKAVWSGFLRLDPGIKIPAMIFVPLYVAVNIKYGPEVAKELTPLWICGPLLVALYIKIVHGLCLLYIYSFKQSVNVVKHLPVYYNYVVIGKLKETIIVRLWKPVVEFRNLGYKGIWKNVREWIVDKYLDYIESIWPYYCKLIRFLKRANFI